MASRASVAAPTSAASRASVALLTSVASRASVTSRASVASRTSVEMSRAAVAAAAVRATFRWRTARRLGAALVFGGLVVDYAFHEWDFLIQLKMRAMMESDQALESATPAPAMRLPMVQPPLHPASKLSKFFATQHPSASSGALLCGRPQSPTTPFLLVLRSPAYGASGLR